MNSQNLPEPPPRLPVAERIVGFVGILMIAAAVLSLCPRGFTMGWRDWLTISAAYLVCAVGTDAFVLRWCVSRRVLLKWRILTVVAWLIIFLVCMAFLPEF